MKTGIFHSASQRVILDNNKKAVSLKADGIKMCLMYVCISMDNNVDILISLTMYIWAKLSFCSSFTPNSANFRETINYSIFNVELCRYAFAKIVTFNKIMGHYSVIGVNGKELMNLYSEE